MQPVSQSPSYLSRNPYSYCFRMKIPRNLRSIIAKKELRYSLKTGNLSDAKNKARYMAGQFQLLFRGMQKGNFAQMNLTKEQILNLITEHKEKLFKEYERPVMYGQYDSNTPYDERQLDMGVQYQWIEFYGKWLKECLALGNYSGKFSDNDPTIEQKVDDALKRKGISLSKGKKSSDQYAMLCQGFIRAELKGLERREQILEGNFSDDLEKIFADNPYPQIGTFAPSLPPADTTPKPVGHGPRLSEFMERFGQIKTNWSKSTRADYETAKKIILKILGDVPVGSLDRSTMVDYRETLLKVPAYWTTRYKNIPVSGLPISGADTLGSDTIGKNISFVNQLMDYAVDCGHLSDSPMPKSKMSLPDDKTDVKSFGDDQVTIIMAVTRDFKDHRYWIPRLGLYTGCRLNEICQLHREDLKEKDGIWYLDINDQGKRSLKNKASRRLVPLHRVLIDLGFIEYVQEVNHHRIFPDCKYRAETGKYTNNFGNWHRRLLENNGIKKKGDRSITFHSFRHRFITVLKRLKADHLMVQQLVGHAMQGTADREYFDGHLLPDLKETLEKIPDHRTN